MFSNVKLARVALERWGLWWRNAERNHGKTSISVMAKIEQQGRLGTNVQTSNKRHSSDDMHAPRGVCDIDDKIEQLAPEFKRVLCAIYVKRLSPKKAAVWLSLSDKEFKSYKIHAERAFVG